MTLLRACLLILPALLIPAGALASFTFHVGGGPLESMDSGEPLGLQGEPGFFRDQDFGYLVGGSYRFTRHFGVDATWLELDSGMSLDDNLYRIATLGGDVSNDPLDLRASGVRLMAELLVPFEGDDEFSFFVRGGMWYWDARIGRDGQRRSFSGSDPAAGMGLRFGRRDRMHFDLAFDFYRMDDVDIDWVSLQFNFPLDRKHATP